jgi:hypothetical protein
MAARGVFALVVGEAMNHRFDYLNAHGDIVLHLGERMMEEV